jgi:radical SAM protein
MPQPAVLDFAKKPILVYWENTQACPLACRHCRASAVPRAHPLELTTQEGFRLLDGLAAFGNPLPHLVMTGGDPLRRRDLAELIGHARRLGMKVSVTPAASGELTREKIFWLKEIGVESIALSLDGSTAERHDAIRQVPGCFANTLGACRDAGDAGLPLQVNTLVAEETVDDLAAVYRLLEGFFPVMRWSLFYLIAVGRGMQLHEVSPEKGEELMHWTYDLAQTAPFQIKTTEAPSYRRVAVERMKRSGMSAEEQRRTSVHRGYSIRDGNGIVFVSHRGEVYPSGFLPLSAGNVRTRPITEIYRSSEVFRSVRDVQSFSGKCGKCEFRKICGGSRARAYAHTGDPAGSDPLCPYQPAAA